MNCARMVTYCGELLRLRIIGVCGTENSLSRPNSNMSVYCELLERFFKLRALVRLGRICVYRPPAAVTSRVPSGETWQLYTSKSLSSPIDRTNELVNAPSPRCPVEELWVAEGATWMGQPQRLDEMHCRE